MHLGVQGERESAAEPGRTRMPVLDRVELQCGAARQAGLDFGWVDVTGALVPVEVAVAEDAAARQVLAVEE
jgi:hypothetical protein